jgi:hypothetical protein
MNLIHDYPPNYQDIIKVFPAVASIKTVIFTYGNYVYYPGKIKSIVEHLKVHERTHRKQQGDDPAGWWKKYLADPKFRLDQEVEAYRNQYQFYKGRNHNLKEQVSFLGHIADDLSSEIYGGIISRAEAIDLIKYV